jgi:hypothetical protein
MKSCLRCLASVALLVALAAPARGASNAPAQEAIDRVVAANREGVALYQSGQLAAARKTIKTALELCKTVGLERHPVAARTHLHLGIILIDGFGQTAAGAKEFREALAIEPTIELTPGLATSAAQVAFDEAVALAPPPIGAAPAAPPPTAAPPLTAAPTPTAAPPPPVEESAADTSLAPVLARRAPVARDDEDEVGDDSDDEDGSWSSRLDLRLLTGMGGGWASGAGELNVDAHTGSASFSGSVLNHATAAVGYWWSPTWMVALEGRFQRVAGPNVVDANGRTYHPASGAVAVFATATWSPQGGALRPFVSASLGAGRIREVVTLAQLHDCGASHAETCVDTVGGGPALVGAAAGFTYGFSKKLALVAGLGTQLAFPESTFNLDLNAGFAFRL